MKKYSIMALLSTLFLCSCVEQSELPVESRICGEWVGVDYPELCYKISSSLIEFWYDGELVYRDPYELVSVENGKYVFEYGGVEREFVVSGRTLYSYDGMGNYVEYKKR